MCGIMLAHAGQIGAHIRILRQPTTDEEFYHCRKSFLNHFSVSRWKHYLAMGGLSRGNAMIAAHLA
jgi:hypothetical protein